MENLERAKRKACLPVVLAVQEVRQVLACLRDTPKLMAELIYGTGLRVMDACNCASRTSTYHLIRIGVRAGINPLDDARFYSTVLYIHSINLRESHGYR